MDDDRPLGIVVVAVGIDEATRNRFKKTLNAASRDFLLHVIREMPDFTRSKARNQGILALLDTCSAIVCTDVDMLVPPGLVEYTRRAVDDGVAVWAKCRNLPAQQADGLDWEAWAKLPVRHSGTGSWVAMTAADWLKVGGWDERLAGHGGEDDVLTLRRKEHGIETLESDYFPLMHVNHAWREQGDRRVGVKNLELGQSRPPKNYLAARLPVLDHYHNHFNIFVTTACARDCPECSQRGFRTVSAGYDLSLDELSEWIDCTKASGYPPYRSIILTGGEPLLWERLEEGARMLHESGLGEQLNLFSNGDPTEYVTDSLMESLSTLRLSHYGNNAQEIQRLKQRYGPKVSVVQRQRHFPIPKALAGSEVLPAECGCQGPALMGRRVYGCAMLVTVAEELDIDLAQYPESHCPLQAGYLELLAGFPRTRHDCCRGCIGNLTLRKQTVSANP